MSNLDLLSRDCGADLFDLGNRDNRMFLCFSFNAQLIFIDNWLRLDNLRMNSKTSSKVLLYWSMLDLLR